MQDEKEEEPLCGDVGEFLKEERERRKGDYKPCDYCNQHDYI